ncbi:MAG TPA: hypothetical protein ENG12_01650 [Candidatus Altiarchaeales archaeon]|nr:hypothetical protein [Candidatus Altiarchaeales archaeon]
MESAIRYFISKAYKIWGKIWYDKENIKSWSELAVDNPEYLGGVDTDWWWGTAPYEEPGLQFPFFADHFWNTRYKVVYFDSFEEDKNKDGFPDGWHYTGSLEPEPNLIQNPSFESDFAGWEIAKTNLGTPAIDTTTYHSGEKSAYFRSDGTSASTIRIDYIPIEPDTDYVLGAWARGINITVGDHGYHRLYLVGRFYDENYQMLPTPDCFADIYSFDTGTFDWKYFEHIHHSPENARYWKITSLGITGTGSGEGWIDDVVFRKHVPEPYSCDGKHMQGIRIANYPNCAVSVKGYENVWYSDPIPITPETEYILSVYIKRQNDGEENPGIRLVWLDSDLQEISEETDVIGNVSTEYKAYEVSTVSPENSEYLRIYLQGEENGKEYFWFDTLRLKEGHRNIPPLFLPHRTIPVKPGEPVVLYIQAKDLNNDSLIYTARLINGDSISSINANFTAVLLGDFDNDKDVDYSDFAIFSSAFGSAEGDENYNPLCDFNFNGVIDGSDYYVFRENFGTTAETGALSGLLQWTPSDALSGRIYRVLVDASDGRSLVNTTVELGVCHNADKDCDMEIDNAEIISCIEMWFSGDTGMREVVKALEIWKSGYPD